MIFNYDYSALFYVGIYELHLSMLFSVDPCQNSPCGDNGKCSRDAKTPTGFKCRCLRGFVGQKCEGKLHLSILSITVI